MSLPLITVVSATSKQGTSVVNALLDSKKYRVRALTRNASSEDAKKLAARGAEIVVADPGNKEQLQAAFRGAYGVYALTAVYPPEYADEELRVGKLQGDLAVEEGVKHIVFSSLENVDEISKGKYLVPHFTKKAEVEAYIRTLPITSSFVYLAYFYTNLIEYYVPRKQEDGTLVFSTPLKADSKYPFVDPTTAPGPVVLAVFENPTQYAGRSIPIVGDELTPNEVALTGFDGSQTVQIFTKVTGIPAKFHTPSQEEWLNSGLPKSLADELYQMCEFSSEFGYFRSDRDLKESRQINPNITTWETFLKSSQWKGEPFAEWKARTKY